MRLSPVVLAGFLAVACGSSNPNAPTTTVQATYEGAWSGQTAQTQKINFRVSGNLVNSVSFDYVSSAPCNLAGGFAAGTNTAVSAISNGVFSINFVTGGGPTTSWTLVGSFSSATTAGGTLTVNLTSPGTNCSGVVQTTWTATKVP
jgi:hypothetical protein